MTYNVLFGGDLHKRMKDITTIRGYKDVCLRIEIDIMEMCKEHDITHFISLGDWFDKGYGSDTAAALAHTDIDREFAKQLKGNFYGLIGNHIRINMDSNPELFLIQPHPYYHSRHSTIRDQQIIKTPKYLRLNDVQISFMHFNKDAESARDYKPFREEWAKYHIALFHTPYVIPTMELHNMGMTNYVNDNSSISACLEDVDLAIVGDIHKPIGTFTINKNNDKSTIMIVPGSLTNTDAGLGSRHDSIEMPFIRIDDNGNVSLAYLHKELRTNELTFIKKTLTDEDNAKLRSIRGNNKETLYEGLEQVSFADAAATEYLSLNQFLRSQNYTSCDRELIKTVLHEPENTAKMISLMRENDTTGI